MTKRILSATLAAALLASACGGGDSEDTTAPEEATQEAPTPTDAPAATEPRIKPADMLVRLEDLPPGWMPATDDDDDAEVTEECDIKDLDDVPVIAQAEAEFETESSGVYQLAMALESTEAAANGGDMLAELLKNCSFETDGVTVTFAEQSYQSYGDASWALKMRFDGEVDGVEMSGVVDASVIIVQVDANLSMFMQFEIFGIDAVLSDQLLTLITARMRGEEPPAMGFDDEAMAEEGVLDEEGMAELEAETSPGSETTPLPIGQSATVGEYTVTVTQYIPNGNEAVRVATDEEYTSGGYYTPPAPGNVYVLVYVDATYNGPDEGNPAWDLSVGYVGSDRRVYNDSSSSNCTESPDDIGDEPTLVSGGTASGSFCVEVPEAVVGTGNIFVEELMSFDGTRAWWAGA